MERSDQFVASKLSLLREETHCSADQVDQAWARVSKTLVLPRRQRVEARYWPFAAAGALALAMLSTPVVTIWAQTVWTRIVLGRTAGIEVDLKFSTPNLLLPNVFPLYPAHQNQRWEVSSVAAASEVAGFTAKTLTIPSLPAPRVQVILPPTIRHVVNLQAAESDLRRFGRKLPTVPPGLDGSEIVLEPQGKSVWSWYGECPELIGPGKACAMLVQAPPMTLGLPSGVSHEDFTRFSLELAGLPPDAAQALANWSRMQPTLFVPLEARSELRRVRVRGGEGTLIVYPQQNGETAFALEWQEGSFLYRLFGRGPENAISLAESLR